MPYATIKDNDKTKLEQRIEEMKQRGYELVSRKSRNGYTGVVHYAKLKARDV